MSIEPAKKIIETPVIRREENTALPRRKKPKEQKKERGGSQRIDIRI